MDSVSIKSLINTVLITEFRSSTKYGILVLLVIISNKTIINKKLGSISKKVKM